MKKVISLLLALVSIISMFGICANAAVYQSTDSRNFTYSFDTDTKTMTVSGSGKLYMLPNLKQTGDVLRNFMPVTETLVFDNGITSLDTGTPLSLWNSLKKIVVPKTLTDMAFVTSSSPNTLVEFKVDENNTAYSSINGVLFNKDKTELLRYPASKAEKEYTIPDSVKRIHSQAFKNACNLEKINTNQGLTSILTEAFANCSKLQEVTISSTVSNILTYAFRDSKKLTTINVNKDNEYYSDIDGVLFDKNAETLKFYPQGKTETVYTVPSFTVIIDTSAFEDNLNIEKVYTNNVTNVEDFAFRGCKKLKEVYLENVKTINTYVFTSCPALEFVQLSSALTFIGKSSFKYCDKLTNVSYPLCENCFNKVVGKEYLTVSPNVYNDVLNCKPCAETTSYKYADNAEHNIVATCSMCHRSRTVRTENCSISNGVCLKCHHEEDSIKIKIKMGMSTWTTHVKVMPNYDTIEKVPDGLKIVGYWYKDNNGDICELKEGEALADNTTTYFARCKLDRPIFRGEQVINYFSYLISALFFRIF